MSLLKTREKLKADAEKVERDVREERELCARRLASVSFESTDALTAESRSLKKHSPILKKKEAVACDLTGAQKALLDAQILKGKFKASEDAQEALAESKKKGSMDELCAGKRQKRQLLLEAAENAL